MIEYNPFQLLGKTILVTGASSGIGKATAIECSKLGANLIVTARNAERLTETLNELATDNQQSHKMILADLTAAEELENLISEVGKIDGVVLCSGKGVTLPVQFSTREHFNDIFETNFFSPFELVRRLYKSKQINKEGSIVTIASLGGIGVFSGGNSIYGASKAAMNSIMKFCAKEFAPRKVRVNCICPGMVETPLIHRGTISEEQLEEDKKRYPLKRYGTPDDIAHLAAYLLSDASSWMTGTSITIDGGISI